MKVLAGWRRVGWTPSRLGRCQSRLGERGSPNGNISNTGIGLFYHSHSRQPELPPGAVYCKFDRILPFWSNHAVNVLYSCSFLSKFESQACPSLGKRLGCAAALYTVLLFVLCMHSAKPVQNIQLSPQIRESVLSHFTCCFLLRRKRKISHQRKILFLMKVNNMITRFEKRSMT